MQASRKHEVNHRKSKEESQKVKKSDVRRWTEAFGQPRTDRRGRVWKSRFLPDVLYEWPLTPLQPHSPGLELLSWRHLFGYFWAKNEGCRFREVLHTGNMCGNIIRNIKATYWTDNYDFWTLSHHFWRYSRNLTHFWAINDGGCMSPKIPNMARNANLLH